MQRIIFFMLCLIILSDFPMKGQGNWVQKANFVDNRGNATCFTIGNKLYVLTGYGTIFNRDLWEWDQTTNIWTQKADLPSWPRLCAVAFSIGLKGYIGTGEIDGGSIDDFWEWDQSSNSWTRKANFPGGKRTQAVGFSMGNEGYIGTGFSDSLHTQMKDFWKWDQATDTWTSIPDYGGGKVVTAVSFTIGDKAYVGTGYNGPYSWSQAFWEFDPVLYIWNPIADFGGGGREFALGFSIGNKGYVGMGADYTNCYSDLWQWDPTTNLWQKMADIPGGVRYWAINGSIGSKGYIGTGSNNGFYEYSADSITTGIDLNKGEIKDFTICPNPTAGVFNINFEYSSEIECSLEITDVKGLLIYKTKFAGNFQTVSDVLLNKPKGNYLVKIKSNNFSETKTVIIN